MKTKSQIVCILAFGVSWLAWSQDLPTKTEPANGTAPDKQPEVPNIFPNNLRLPVNGPLNPEVQYYAAENRQGIGPVSVTCFKEPDQRTLGEINEDLSVLAFLIARNLERSFAGEANEYKLGIPMLLTSAGHSVEASYIQGFGAIFNMQVRFPLVAPAGSSEESPAAKRGSEWQEARRALLSRPKSEVAYSPAGWGPGPNPYSEYSEDQGYNEKLVEILKKRVLNLLKNASNLRHVGEDEWIVVRITGAPGPVQPTTSLGDSKPGKDTLDESDPTGRTSPGQLANTLPQTEDKGRPTWYRFQPGTTIPAANSAPTIMTLRVNKSAVDAFAAGRASEEQFMNHAEVATYLEPGFLSAHVSERAQKK